MLKIFGRAAQNLPLTPWERAILRMVGSLWQTGLAAGVVAVLEAISNGGQPLTLGQLAHVAAVAAAAAVVSGIAKLTNAQGDPPLTTGGNANTVVNQTAAPQAPAQLRDAWSMSPARRRDLLAQSGARPFSDFGSGPLGATTKPVPAATAPDPTSATSAQATTTAASAPTDPAPSDTATGDDPNGAVTQVMAAAPARVVAAGGAGDNWTR